MKPNKTYKNQIANLFVILSLFVLTLQNSQANHALVLTSDIEFSCDQTKDNQAVKCAYRFVVPEITKMISAKLGSTELPIKDIKTYPFEDSTTSILLLVDSSKSENPEQIQQTRSQIIALAQQALPSQKIGLATFDENLKIIKPLGSDPEEIIQIAEGLTETEQPTDLYRNLLDAINLLNSSQSDRKAVYIFSNGISEDQAIYHRDVIKAALKANINIISIAYPVASNPIDTTQTLRRLSKDTGGIFIKSSENDFELPESFISDPFAAIDNGGILSIDLTPILTGDVHGIQLAMLMFETSSKRITVKLPLELTSSSNETTAQLTGDNSVITNDGSISEEKKDEEYSLQEEHIAKQNQPVTNQEEIDSTSNTIGNAHKKVDTGFSLFRFWPIIPIGLLILGFTTFFLLKNKKTNIIETKEDQDNDTSSTQIGWLISQTDSGLRYPINNSPWKVGRTRENDLFLEHSSVSRKHAEFKRNRDGSLTVIDLDSLNGVFLNNTKVSTGLVKDQDKIDIGDVRMKFVLKLEES